MVYSGMDGESKYSSLEHLSHVLLDENYPLYLRFRALFTLKNIKTEEAVKCFSDSSELFKHEIAYCLGQMQHFSAIPTLIKIIEDCTQEAVVRHEAAEALAAFRDPKFIEVLRRFTSSECVELAETCKIAVDYLKWISDLQSDQEKSSVSVFGTLDPAPPLDNKIDNAAGLDEIARIFMDTNQPLFSRYRAMFSLRNIGTREAVEVLIEGFKDSSALFKHEIAFVFGQLQSEYAVQSLMNVLRDDTEHPMVRHEAAEALGAIASRKEIYTLLKEFSASHHPRIIRESCHVALDMYEYGKSEEFEYTLNHFS